VPAQLETCLKREKVSIPMANDYGQLRAFLLQQQGVTV
jgi:hypothetical protein